MEKQLPIYKIEGTEFVVDVRKNELRQKDNPANTISFHDMLDLGNSYTFSFDKTRKNFPAPFSPQTENIVKVNVPQMVHLDPSGMAEKYGFRLADLEGKNDFDIIVDQKLLTERLNGILPLIKIAGHDFIIDLRLNELRPMDDFSTRINLKDLDVSNDGEKFLCFYHLPSKQVVDVSPTLTELPKDVVMLEIPNELVLDPVGIAKMNGLPDSAFLKQYPIQKNLEAKVVALSETGLPRLIEKNKRQITRQRQGRKSLKNKKGKRL